MHPVRLRTEELKSSSLSNVYGTGSYVELGFLPSLKVATAIRRDALMNMDTKSGIVRYSASGMYFESNGVYLGLEYTLKTDIIDDPLNVLTGLIGYEF